jgi:CheY-like chemotaxis protein
MAAAKRRVAPVPGVPKLPAARIEALVVEGLTRLASPETCNRIVAAALEADGVSALPVDPRLLSTFVAGPLWKAAQAQLGDETADALIQDLGPLLRLAAAQASEIVAPAKRRSKTLRPPAFRPESGVVESAPTDSELPAAPKRMTAPYIAAWCSAAPSNLILFVDDDVLFLRAFARLLRLEGYDVIDAPTGGAAVTLCQQLNPQLVITDWNMPDMDGEQLVGLILDRMGAQAPKMVMLTGAANPPANIDGVAKVLVKDIGAAAIIQAITPLLEQA